MSRLDDSLRLVLPELPAPLVDLRHRDAMRRLARHLAPLHCAGFEVRLGGGAGGADLQQRLLALDGEPQAMARHIRASGLEARPEWRRVTELCEVWARPGSPLDGAVRGCWHEFDLGGAAAPHGGDHPVPAPSVFLSFTRRLRERRAIARVAGAAFAILQGRPLPGAVLDAMVACADACPEPAGLGDVGILLGRRADGLRVVLGELGPAQATALLSTVVPEAVDGLEEALELVAGPRPRSPVGSSRNLPGRSGAAAGAGSSPPAGAAGDAALVVSLDVGTSVSPRVGLEVFPGSDPRELPAWRRLLDGLVRAGRCTGAERDALLAWPGVTVPTSTGSGPWPDDLVVASLLRPTREFSVLERRLHHVKIVHVPGRPPRAKAYLGYGALWLVPEEEHGGERHGTKGAVGTPGGAGPLPPVETGAVGRGGSREGVRRDAAGGRDGGPSVRRGAAGERDRGPSAGWCRAAGAALEAATAFLGRARDAAGAWWDFPAVVGGSDEWLTGYVATALQESAAATGDGTAGELAREAWRWLLGRRRDDGGWGWARGLPSDADSTAWGLRLGDALKVDDDVLEPGLRLLRHHVTAAGGIASYLPESTAALEPWLDLPDDTCGDPARSAGRAGLTIPHAAVTAAAAVLPGLPASCREWLRDAQRPDGSWHGYWWCDPDLATTLALEALSRRPGLAGLEACRDAAVAWIETRSARPGHTAFTTALHLWGLAGRGPGDRARAAARRLLDTQLPDGSWPASARLRVPPPWSTDPDADARHTFVAVDELRAFTTATAIRALTEATRQGAEELRGVP